MKKKYLPIVWPMPPNLEQTRCICKDIHNKILMYTKDKYGQSVNTVRCKYCGTVRTEQAPSGAWLDDYYYSGHYVENHPGSLHRSDYGERTARWMFDSIKYAWPSSFVEIGAGDGSLTRSLSSLTGSVGYAYDAYPHNKRVKVPCLIQKSRLAIASHVLEHTRDPVSSINSWYEQYTTDDLMIIVPDWECIESLGDDFVKYQWLTFDHLWQFTSDTLQMLINYYAVNDDGSPRYEIKHIGKIREEISATVPSLFMWISRV